MIYFSLKNLTIHRRLANNSLVPVGTLTQHSDGIYFQYTPEYLNHYTNLSPFKLHFDDRLQLAPKQPHHGLHGVFADSLPDGWGTLVFNKVLQQAGIDPKTISPLERLAFVGHNGMGALTYEPISTFQPKLDEYSTINTIGLQAQQLFDGETNQVLDALALSSNAGGARPKAQLYLNPQQPEICSLTLQAGMKPYLVKFTSKQFVLWHEESLCEAAYLTIAAQAGINTQRWQLIPAPPASQATAWLALERFDCTEQGGRLHMHSVAGLLDTDYRDPSLDYKDLIKLSTLLCNDIKAGQELFRRALFNLLAMNQDDHAKNWAFLMNDQGKWQLSPFYDVLFTTKYYNEHMTAFAGYGKTPPLKAIQQLADTAGFENWQAAQQVIQQIMDAMSTWDKVAKNLGISKDTRQLITKELNSTWQKTNYLCH